MKITTTARKVTLKQNFIDTASARLEKLDKFFSDNAEAQITVTVEKNYQTVEITVRDKGGFVVRCEKSAPQMEQAFDEATDVLQKRIIKNRKRLITRISAPVRDEYMAEPVDDEPYKVIREKHFNVKPQTVDEAILEMNLLDHEFFMFRNSETNLINVVYKRKDETYGLLIPE